MGLLIGKPIYTQPQEWRSQLQAELGQFPLFNFWGPNTSIRCSQWIADSAKWVEERCNPTLTLIYLPHLDYCLQKFGPHPHLVASDLLEIDALCGDLIEYYENRGAQVIVLSEYGITAVSQPVHLNRMLRQKGLLTVREELGRELLDPGASKAFAVADHQVAHVYVNDPFYIPKVRSLLEATDGVAYVLDNKEKQTHHLNHPRSGELVAVSQPDSWFTYYYWLDDNHAPDFARTVDIHRKPGYDPVELFLDPQIKLPKLKIGLKLLRKQLGFRYLMDVIPLDASLVRGSHGCVNADVADGPFLDSQRGGLLKSSYEYPGRYKRWAIGFINPPLELKTREKSFTLTALNGRGKVLIPVLLKRLSAHDQLEEITLDKNYITGLVKPAIQQFTEEERSKQPSAFTVIRDILHTFSSNPSC